MAVLDDITLDGALLRGDVSSAWVIWSCAAEIVFAEAFFAGALDKGLVLGRGSARFRTVRLGGPQIRRVRGNFADHHAGADVVMYQDSTFAFVLDLRRRLKAVLDVFDGILRGDVIETDIPIRSHLSNLSDRSSNRDGATFCCWY